MIQFSFLNFCLMLLHNFESKISSKKRSRKSLRRTFTDRRRPRRHAAGVLDSDAFGHPRTYFRSPYHIIIDQFHFNPLFLILIPASVIPFSFLMFVWPSFAKLFSFLFKLFFFEYTPVIEDVRTADG